MIKAVAALAHSAKLSPGPDATPSDVALQQPTQVQAADFARAVGSAPPLETTAAMPTGGEGLSTRLAAQVDQLSSHLQTLRPEAAATSSGAAQSTGAGHPLADAQNHMSDAIAQMERAYMFAIETTMASRGSTETTKIFNTLLKGQ